MPLQIMHSHLRLNGPAKRRVVRLKKIQAEHKRTNTGTTDKRIPEPHIGSRVSTASEADERSSKLTVAKPVHVTALTAKKKQSPNGKR
jgi:hypothetical protein